MTLPKFPVPKTLPVLESAVSSGINYGWMRAHKHNESPSAETIKDEIEKAIMFELFEAFNLNPMDTDGE